MKSFIHLLFLILILLAGTVGGLYYQQTTNSNFGVPFWSLKTSLISPDTTTPPEPIKKTVENIIPKSPCEKTLYYSFGKLDERYNITNKELHEIMNQVEKIWEDNSEYNLFEYKEDAEFKINFVFDSRQERTLLNERLDNQLLELKKSQKSIFSKHTTLTDKYESLWDKYSDDLADFEKDVKKYNKAIKYWNDKGGAPEKEYAALLEDGKKLSKKQTNLEGDQKKINKLVKKINKLTNKGASLIDEYNSNVSTYNSKFGVAKNFTQGKYFGNKINVYQFRDDADLILTLAHEFGHALGINHVQNSTSIMYYLMKDQPLNNIKLTKEDIIALDNICALN
jgi:vacuolar-type H+-ATPase subunit I/STV1